MAKRRKHRASGALEGRSERPATGHGQPRAGRQAVGFRRLKTCGHFRAPQVENLRPLQAPDADHMRKLKVCQRRRRSHWPTVRLPTWIRAVPRIPGVNTASASSSVISAS